MPPTRARNRKLRAALAAVALIFVGVAVAAGLSTQRLVRDQEERLLEQKSNEVGAMLGNAFRSGETSMRMLNGVRPESADLVKAYADNASSLLRPTTIAITTVAERPGGLFVLAGVGKHAPVGSVATGAVAALAKRALATGKMTSTIVREGDARRYALAVPAAAPSRVVTFQESTIDPRTPVKREPGSPFRELRVALYATDDANEDMLLLATEKEVPLRGKVLRSQVPIGADSYLMEIAAKEPLTGPFAQRMPWVLFGGGLVAALLAGVTVHVLSRRSDYALRLVDKRTTELTVSVTELAETRAFLERMLSAGPLLVVRADTVANRVTYVSPNIQRLFGFTDTDARTEKFLADHTHPDDLPHYRDALGNVASGRTAQAALEVRLRDSSDQDRWIATQLVPEFDAEGGVVAVITYIVDVNDRRHAEEAQREAQQIAETANEAKSAFLSHMSHELRTPLNAVLGFGQILELEDISEEQHEAVGHILNGGRHLLSLINEVLDISRIETGDLSLSLEAVDPAELIRESVELIGPIAVQRRVSVSIEAQPLGDCYVYADRQRAKQVLLNLLSNAVKYNRPGGHVNIQVRRADERCVVSVATPAPVSPPTDSTSCSCRSSALVLSTPTSKASASVWL